MRCRESLGLPFPRTQQLDLDRLGSTISIISYDTIVVTAWSATGQHRRSRSHLAANIGERLPMEPKFMAVGRVILRNFGLWRVRGPKRSVTSVCLVLHISGPILVSLLAISRLASQRTVDPWCFLLPSDTKGGGKVGASAAGRVSTPP